MATGLSPGTQPGGRWRLRAAEGISPETTGLRDRSGPPFFGVLYLRPARPSQVQAIVSPHQDSQVGFFFYFSSLSATRKAAGKG